MGKNQKKQRERIFAKSTNVDFEETSASLEAMAKLKAKKEKPKKNADTEPLKDERAKNIHSFLDKLYTATGSGSFFSHEELMEITQLMLLVAKDNQAEDNLSIC